MHSALELARVTPQDAAPLHAAALESLIRGDRVTAISYLQDATQRDQFSSFHQSALQAAIEVYQLAGRPENDAQARVFLESTARWDSSTAYFLEQQLGLIENYSIQSLGHENVAPLLLDAHQKAISSPDLDLHSYLQARGGEIDYLRGFLRGDFQKQTPSSGSQYLSAPASDMLTAAESEMKELRPILYFYLDKPGIYQRLDDGQRTELIQRIGRDGEMSAFQWAYQTRPDIFHSADFVPQGLPRAGWVEFVQQWAAANQSGK